MEPLLRGILRFRKETLPSLRPTFERLAEGQSPDTLFIACSDSRIVPNLLVASQPGDLFVVRTVGNVVAPILASGATEGDVSEAAAIEYAVEVLGVKYIVVCGHSGCGAMKAIQSDGVDPARLPHLAQWLAVAKPAMPRLARSPFIEPTLPPEDRLSQANVLEQLDNVLTYGIVRDRVEDGRLHLTGWWFDVARGDVHVFDEPRGRFVLLDEEEAERVLSGLVDVHPKHG